MFPYKELAKKTLIFPYKKLIEDFHTDLEKFQVFFVLSSPKTDYMFMTNYKNTPKWKASM